MRIFLILAGVFFFSCEKYSFQDLAHSQINIENIQVQFAQENNWSHAIEDVWVFVDDAYLGTFPIPAKIPILEKGAKKISIFPGINYYGIVSKPEIYTPIVPFTLQVDLFNDKELNIKPIFNYKPNLNNLLDDNFESGTVFINDLDTLAATKLIRIANARSGLFAGELAVQTNTKINEMASSPIFNLKNKNTFLEIDFWADHEFNIGIIDANTKSKNYFIKLLPTENKWKKIYIPLFELLDTTEIKSFLIAIKIELLPSKTSGSVRLDNIKIIALP